jgi:hypothetical protein
MKDEEKSKEQLLNELIDLRRTFVAGTNGNRLKEEYNKAKENEEKYYNLFQNSNDAIFIQETPVAVWL